MKTRNATIAEKVTALATAELAGSAAEAGRLLNVPERSIRQWRQEGKTNPEIARLVEQATNEAKDELVVQVSDMLPKLVKFIGKKVTHLIETDAEVTPRDLQALSTTAGIWVDKMALWDKTRSTDGGGEAQPTSPPADISQLIGGKASGKREEMAS
jgi:hypothetical protein